jgi:hypothetical protein
MGLKTSTHRTIAIVRQTLVMVGTLTESTDADPDTPKLLDTDPEWFYGVVLASAGAPPEDASQSLI